MEARIKILRGDNDIIATSSEKLEVGQPLYNKDKNYLTIGSLDSNNNTKLVNIQPISTRNVKGWYSDNDVISKIDNSEDFYYFGSNDNKTLLKGVTELDVNIGSANYINLKSNGITINKDINITADNIIPTLTANENKPHVVLGTDTNRFASVYSTSGNIITFTSKDLFSTNIGSTDVPIANIHTTSANIECLTGDKLIGNYITMGPDDTNLDIKIGSNGNDNTFCIKGASTSNVATNFKMVSSYTDDGDYILFNYNRAASNSTPQQLNIKGFASSTQDSDFRCKIYGTLEVNAINLITT